jgi:hypothetical protein
MAYFCEGKTLTIIGAGGLNCRVRDGTGCTPTALITNYSLLTTGVTAYPALLSQVSICLRVSLHI